MADQTQTGQPWKPAVNPWLIAASVMLATFMEVLDTSVANVSLNYIAGGLAVSNDEATWVLTSYLEESKEFKEFKEENGSVGAKSL